MRGATQAYLAGLREVLTELLKESGSGLLTPYSTPAIITVTFTAALAPSWICVVLPSIIALTMLTLSAWGSLAEELKGAVKPVVTVTAFSAFVSTPLLLSRDFSDAAFFIARVVASSITFIMLVRAAGWSRVLKGLRYLALPETLVLMIEEAVRFIPSFLGDALTLTSAREARTLGDSGTLSTWRTLSTVASELILRANARAQKVLMAIKSRTLAGSGNVTPRSGGYRSNVSYLDVLLYLLAVLMVLMEVVITAL